MPPVDFDLCLITDRRQCRRGDVEAAVEEALRGGVRAVQLRDKDLPARERFELGVRLRRLTAGFGAKLLVNGDAALALALEADGVHLPQDGLPADVCRKLLGSAMLVGVSTHGLEEAREAEGAGADFVTCGPVFYTSSKAKYGPPLGLDSLREVCEAVSVGVIALGGIKAADAADILAAGAAGVAMISAILAEDDVEAAASEVLRRLRQARTARVLPEKEG